jgi:hypothetical protein
MFKEKFLLLTNQFLVLSERNKIFLKKRFLLRFVSQKEARDGNLRNVKVK